MDENERHIIDDLFGKLRQAEARSGPRDREAEDLIRRHVGAQPAAPYYMAQAIVVQEQALAASQARVQELERQLTGRPAGGGFLAGLFGGGGSERLPAAGAGRIGPSSACESISVSWSRKSGTPCSSSGGVASGARRAAALPRQRAISSNLLIVRNSCNIDFSRTGVTSLPRVTVGATPQAGLFAAERF